VEVLPTTNVIVINFILIQTAQRNVSDKDNIYNVTFYKTKILATGSD